MVTKLNISMIKQTRKLISKREGEIWKIIALCMNLISYSSKFHLFNDQMRSIYIIQQQATQMWRETLIEQNVSELVISNLN